MNHTNKPPKIGAKIETFEKTKKLKEIEKD
jgi:hypothetical protein